MPQDSLFSSDKPMVGLQIEVNSLWPNLENGLQVITRVRNLDQPWATLGANTLAGAGQDFLGTMVDDVLHAWWFEDTKAIVRELQRNDRLARKHARAHNRTN